MPSNHLILCCPLLLLPSVFPSIRDFSNESALPIRWPRYWSFSLRTSLPNEYSGLISFWMDWLDILAVQGPLKRFLIPYNSVPTPSFHPWIESPTTSSLYGEHPFRNWNSDSSYTNKYIGIFRHCTLLITGKLNNCTLGWMAREITLSRDFFVQRLVLWHEAALSLKLLKSARIEDSKAVPVSSVQLLSRVRLFVTPWTAAHQASLSTNSRSLLKLMTIKSVKPSNHLILCHPLLLLPSIFPSIRVFSNESALHIRWPKYWSFSFSISPSNKYLGLISFRMKWLDLLAVQGILKSLLQHHNSKASILRHSAFFIIQL